MCMLCSVSNCMTASNPLYKCIFQFFDDSVNILLLDWKKYNILLEFCFEMFWNRFLKTTLFNARYCFKNFSRTYICWNAACVTTKLYFVKLQLCENVTPYLPCEMKEYAISSHFFLNFRLLSMLLFELLVVIFFNSLSPTNFKSSFFI